ncbi:MAG: hypothetical protein ACJ8F7_21610 [Gemmataceae bacterium]
MVIVSAAFNRGAQELVLTGESGVNWSFKAIRSASNLKPGYGFAQELQGRFNEKGDLDVRDVHNDNASDFDIVCGPTELTIRQDCQGTDDNKRCTSRVGRPLNERPGPPGADLIDNVTIRVFSGPPPSSVKKNVGSIWISDPASVVMQLLSESAVNGGKIDEWSGSEAWDEYKPHQNTQDENIGDYLWMAQHHRLPPDRPKDLVAHHPSTLVLVRRRIVLSGVQFEII